MSVEFSNDPGTGGWRFIYRRNPLTFLGTILVVSGISTLNAPWWQGIVIALFNEVGFKIDEEHQYFLAAGQILVGLALFGWKYLFVDRKKGFIKADLKVVSEANLDFNSLRCYLNNLEDDHSFKSRLNSEFQRTISRFETTEYQFQYRPVATAYNTFKNDAKELQAFLSVNFYVYPSYQLPNGDFKYCLAPHLNIDREMLIPTPEKVNEYNQYKVKLHELVSRTKESLEKWIASMKKAALV